MNDTLRHTPFYRALHRPNLVMGCDRELILSIMIICAGLVITSLKIITTIAALVIFIVSLKILRLMAKHDPSLRAIYLRQLKYSEYYTPRSTPFRKD